MVIQNRWGILFIRGNVMGLVRYKLLRPFKKALNAGAPKGELDQLIESVPGVGLRLNCTAKVAGAVHLDATN